MQYSLRQLNKIANLKQLKISEIINKLNLIGLEVDDIIDEKLVANQYIKNTSLVIDIPSNREDLLNENFLLDELATIFNFQLFNFWNNIKSNYHFLLNKQYKKHTTVLTKKIETSFTKFVTFVIQLEHFENITTPSWILIKLRNGGIPESESFVDNLLNLIIVEWGQTINVIEGQPSTFNLKRLNEDKNISSNINNPEILEKGTIILEDENGNIVNILGLVNIKEKKNNSNLYLECSFYDIHNNPLNLKTINTNLSYRYLRRTFLTNLKTAFQRLLTLLEIYTESRIIEVNSIVNSDFPILKEDKIITLTKKSAKKVLNINRYDINIFNQAGFKLVGQTNNILYFLVPTCRNDINREIDLIEEYSRFIGYKNFHKIAPNKQIQYTKNNKKSLAVIKQFFLNYGFNEIMTNSIYEYSKIEKESIKITNPLNKELAILRTSLLPNLVKTFESNLRSNIKNQKFFESGRIFKRFNNKLIEQDRFGGIFILDFQKQTKENVNEYFQAKGFIESLLLNFGYKNLNFVKITNNFNYYHPERSGLIEVNGVILGTFGELSPQYEKLIVNKQKVYLFEFNLNSFKSWRINSNIISYKNYSRYPAIVRDLSVKIDKNTNFTKLKEIASQNIKNLKNIQILDIYFDASQQTLVNLTLRLEFQSEIETLRTEVIEFEVTKIIENLKSNFEIEI